MERNGEREKREGGRLRGTAELNMVPGQSNQLDGFHVIFSSRIQKETQVITAILLCSQKLNMLPSVGYPG